MMLPMLPSFCDGNIGTIFFIANRSLTKASGICPICLDKKKCDNDNAGEGPICLIMMAMNALDSAMH